MKFICLLNNNFYFSKRKIFRDLKAITLIIFSLLSTSFLFSQNNANRNDQNFILDASIQGVDFFHVIKSCNGRNVVFLKFNNKNIYKVSISWKEVFATQFAEHVEGFLGKRKVVLSPGVTTEANCEITTNNEFVILPHQVVPTYVAEISKYEFKDITVDKI